MLVLLTVYVSAQSSLSASISITHTSVFEFLPHKGDMMNRWQLWHEKIFFYKIWECNCHVWLIYPSCICYKIFNVCRQFMVYAL